MYVCLMFWVLCGFVLCAVPYLGLRVPCVFYLAGWFVLLGLACFFVGCIDVACFVASVVWRFGVCLFLFGCFVVLCGCAVFAAWLCVLFCWSVG